MSPAQEVCVDASVAVKVVVPEPDSDKADALFDAWASAGKQLIALAFFEVETDSILRQTAETLSRPPMRGGRRRGGCRRHRYESHGRRRALHQHRAGDLRLRPCCGKLHPLVT